MADGRSARARRGAPGSASIAGDGYVDGEEAAALLGVRRETLYAYASRGLIRRIPVPGRRAMAYLREDLDRLKVRAAARAGHGPVAAGALRFGEPVLASSITAIEASGPRYRGALAVDLARAGTSYEEVAERLWGAPPEAIASATPWSVDDDAIPAALLAAAVHVPPGARPIDVLGLVLPWIALDDVERHAASATADHARARRVLPALAALLALGASMERLAAARREIGFARIATVALAGGAAATRAVVSAVERGLVLVADHELNASAFAARIAAGTGADLHACLAAAIATASGPAHGTAADRVLALVDEVVAAGGDARAARLVVASRTARGDAIPGFGHALYPAGDPRAVPLLEEARPRGGGPEAAALLALVDAMRARREHPTVDVGLAALVLSLSLPRAAASGLFVLGRTAGWVAHALEQRATGTLLRPRARYVGEGAASGSPPLG